MHPLSSRHASTMEPGDGDRGRTVSTNRRGALGPDPDAAVGSLRRTTLGADKTPRETRVLPAPEGGRVLRDAPKNISCNAIGRVYHMGSVPSCPPDTHRRQILAAGERAPRQESSRTAYGNPPEHAINIPRSTPRMKI